MKKLPLAADASVWYKKWSTWLSGVAVSALGAYALLPEGVKATIPNELLLGLGMISMFLVPVATSFNQKSCEPKD